MDHRFLDTSLTFEERVEAFLAELTLAEKLTQLLQSSPSIDRLRVPSYRWNNECPHGVADAGVATVFPQTIGLAATFNEDLIYDIATAISDEARAKYNEFRRQSDLGMNKLLTVSSPHLGIYRDPRWSLGQDTYGEDPYLISRLCLAFIEGLQGDDDTYLKLAACAKFFDTLPESGINPPAFKNIISPMDFIETYLPPFESAVMHANIAAIMSSFSPAIKDIHDDSTAKLQEILGDEWEYEGHNIAVCNEPIDFLHTSFEQGILSTEAIDISLRQLFMIRFKLGEFDHVDNNPFAKLPYELNDSKEHHKLSLESSIQSMVLLKNTGILPLDHNNLNAIAIVGPNADDKQILLGNCHGTPSVTYTPLDGIKLLVDDETRVYYAEGCPHIVVPTQSAEVSRDLLSELDLTHTISEAISAATYSDVTLVCLGLNAQAELTQGDKNSLKLPEIQLELLEALSRNGSKLITVIFSGCPLELGRIAELSDAVIQAWYPGQFGGLALARLLFGQRDFSGRLPITFVHTAMDLPDYSDYSMHNRTYKFIHTPPLYPFGYGKCYNTYSLKIDTLFSTIQKDAEKDIKVVIKNTGSIASFIPIQMYVKPFHSNYRVPNYKLVHIETMYLNASETKTVFLPFDAGCVQTVNEEGEWNYDCKSFMLYIGLSQPDSRSVDLLGYKPYEKKINLS